MKHAFAGLLLSCWLLTAVAQEPQGPLTVPEEAMQRHLIHRVNPVPPAEPGMRIKGTVVLTAIINKTGDIENLQMVSGHPMLVPSAIEAVRQWRYRPYEVNGIAIDVETTVHVEFPTESDGAPQSDSAAQSAVLLPRETVSGYLVRKVAPIYPPLARQARIQGTVTLRVIIDKEGNVSNLQLVSGHPMLAPAAIEAVKQWRYRPYEQNGETVAVETDVQVNFKLADDPVGRGVPYAPDPAGSLPGGFSGVVGGILASTPTRPLEGERVSEAVMRPLRIQKIDPIYPGVAVQAHVQGTVLLDIRVNTSGGVDEAVRLGGPLTLGPPAIEAVQQWKYTPYVRDGQAISVVSTVSLNFSLAENENGATSEPPPLEEAGPPRIAVPQRVRVSSGVSSGLLVHKVAPEYPPDAREAHIQGTVILRANIDKQGNVANLELVSGDQVLARAAIEAVRQWRYRPYLLNGEAVAVETTIQVNFVLAP